MTHPPRLLTKSEVLASKREILHEIAREFTAGRASEGELEEVAVKFTTALEQKAMENLRGRR
jgi:hypothetical protein